MSTATKPLWRVKTSLGKRSKIDNQQEQQKRVELFQQLKFSNKADWKKLKRPPRTSNTKNKNSQFLFVDLSPKSEEDLKNETYDPAPSTLKINKSLKSPLSINSDLNRLNIINAYPSPTEPKSPNINNDQCIIQNGKVILQSNNSHSSINQSNVYTIQEDDENCHDAKAAFAKIIGKSLNSFSDNDDESSPFIDNKRKLHKRSTSSVSKSSIKKPAIKKSKSFGGVSEFNLKNIVLPSSTPTGKYNNAIINTVEFNNFPITPFEQSNRPTTTGTIMDNSNNIYNSYPPSTAPELIGSPIEFEFERSFENNNFINQQQNNLGLNTPSSSSNSYNKETYLMNNEIELNQQQQFNNDSLIKPELLNFTDEFFQLQIQNVQNNNDLLFEMNFDEFSFNNY